MLSLPLLFLDKEFIMKARIPKVCAVPLVLFYQPSGGAPQSSAVQGLLTGAGIPCRVIGEEHLCQPVGTLCGLEGCAAGKTDGMPPFPHPAMVLCGFGDAGLNKLLRLLRENGLSIPHKAVLTDTNKDWALGFLLEEIERERQAMAAARGRIEN